MALTTTEVLGARNALRRLIRTTIGAAGDYSSGVTIPAVSGIGAIAGVDVLGSTVGATWTFDPTTAKLRGYVQGAGAGLLTEITGAQANGATLLLEVIEDV